MGQIKPKTVAELMDMANRFACGDDADMSPTYL
jgi:hypothetical protein